jgi:hypothetical protein
LECFSTIPILEQEDVAFGLQASKQLSNGSAAGSCPSAAEFADDFINETGAHARPIEQVQADQTSVDLLVGIHRFLMRARRVSHAFQTDSRLFT